MARIELTATATFGLEAVVKREIEGLGYAVTGSHAGQFIALLHRRVAHAGRDHQLVLSVYQRQPSAIDFKQAVRKDANAAACGGRSSARIPGTTG